MIKKLFLGLALVNLGMCFSVKNANVISVNASEEQEVLISTDSELQAAINNVESGATAFLRLAPTMTINNEITVNKPCTLAFEYATTFKMTEKQHAFTVKSDHVNLTFAPDTNFNGENKAYAILGRAIHVEGSYCHITGATFTDCSTDYSGLRSTFSGGAIFVQGENCRVDSCYFNHCTASDMGGGVFIDGDRNTVTNCEFTKCAAGQDGGGIGIAQYSVQNTIEYCKFLECDTSTYSDADGGAIAVHGENNEIDNCEFEKCKARVCGGAIYLKCDDSKITNCTFKKCSTTEDDGGAIYLSIDVDDILIQDCTFEECKAADCGGAICSNSFSYRTHILNCSFNNCVAEDDDGGAICIGFDSDDVVIFGCTFKNCSAGEDGGAIFVGYLADDCIINTCTFENCSADDDGDYVLGDGDTLVQDCVPNSKNSDLFDDCDFSFSANKMTGSFFSNGNFWIILAIVVVGGAAIVAFVLTRRKTQK